MAAADGLAARARSLLGQRTGPLRRVLRSLFGLRNPRVPEKSVLVAAIATLRSEPTEEDATDLGSAIEAIRVRRDLLELAARMTSPKRAVSEAAETALRRKAAVDPDHVVGALGELLLDRNPLVKRVVLSALASTGHPEAVKHLSQLLSSDRRFSDYVVRALAQLVSANRDLRRPVATALSEALAGLSWRPKWRAIEVLGGLRDPYAVYSLSRVVASGSRLARIALYTDDIAAVNRVSLLLRDPTYRVLNRLRESLSSSTVAQIAFAGPERLLRLDAIFALGELGSPRATPILCARLVSGDSRTQIEAANAIARIGDPRSVPIIINVLAVQGVRTLERLRVIGACITALASTESDRADGALTVLLGGPRPRGWSRELLYGLSLVPLRRLYVDQTLAASRLGFTASHQSVVVRLNRLTSASVRGDYPLIEACVMSLTKSGAFIEPQILTSNLERLLDSDNMKKMVAAFGLGKCGLPHALPSLHRVADGDRDADARAAAQLAAWIIGKEQGDVEQDAVSAALGTLWFSESVTSRRFAVWAAARLESEDYRFVLSWAISNDARELLGEAITGLGYLASQSALDEFEVSLLQNLALEDADSEFRYMALDALGATVEWRNQREQQEFLSGAKLALRDPSFRVRIAAAMAIVRTNRSEAHVLQQHLAGNDLVPTVRADRSINSEEDDRARAAIEVILLATNGENLAQAIAWAESPRPWKRMIAAWVLGRRGWSERPELWDRLRVDFQEQVRDIAMISSGVRKKSVKQRSRKSISEPSWTPKAPKSTRLERIAKAPFSERTA